MSFSEQIAKVVADQLERFVTLNPHQLAGHVANLDFWVGEAQHALEVIDGYQERFRNLKEGQEKYVSQHNTRVWSPFERDISTPPASPQRVPDGSLREARRSVVDAVYRFLVRLCNEGLIPETELRARCAELGIGIDPTDLRHRSLSPDPTTD
ncbi:MAG: hypothetical protein ACRC8S_13740 [Fimbriiglobus sp.]